MFQPGCATFIANEIKRYKISILGLSLRYGGPYQETNGTTIIFSGHQEDGAPHTEGVASMFIAEFSEP